MNLLFQYAPGYAGHLHALIHNLKNNTVELLLCKEAEDSQPSFLITFHKVNHLEIDNYDLDADCNELVIGIATITNGYCIHTDQREFVFECYSVSTCELSVS